MQNYLQTICDGKFPILQLKVGHITAEKGLAFSKWLPLVGCTGTLYIDAPYLFIPQSSVNNPSYNPLAYQPSKVWTKYTMSVNFFFINWKPTSKD